MSANLSRDDIKPVTELLERLENVQRAMHDMHSDCDLEADYSCAITVHPRSERESPVAHTHRLSYWVVLQGLAAMERELLQLLQAKEITVESVLPLKENAS